jgi:hypothetical protein
MSKKKIILLYQKKYILQCCSSFVSRFNLLQSFNYAHYLFYKKWFKTEINCFCIRTLNDPELLKERVTHLVKMT